MKWLTNQLGLLTELFPQAASFMSVIAQQIIHLFLHFWDIETLPRTQMQICKGDTVLLELIHCLLKLKPNLCFISDFPVFVLLGVLQLSRQMHLQEVAKAPYIRNE